jgi:hypothetical protein
MVKWGLWPAWLGGRSRKWRLLMAENKIDDFHKISEWVESGRLKISIDSECAFK